MARAMTGPAGTSGCAINSSLPSRKSALGSGTTTRDWTPPRRLPLCDGRAGQIGEEAARARGLQSPLPAAAAQSVAVPPIGAARDEGAMAQPSAAAVTVGIDRSADDKPSAMEVTEVAVAIGAMTVMTPANRTHHVGRSLAEVGLNCRRRLRRRTDKRSRNQC